MIQHYLDRGAALPDLPPGSQLGFDELGPGRAVAGTPDDCIRQLQQCQDTLGCEYLSLMNMGIGPSYGHRGSYDTERPALEVFGREVLPAFAANP